jgi:hypothetical protein
MAPLPGELRTSIERTIIQARDAAEAAAESALAVLQVQTERLPAIFPDGHRPLRNALRARARQLGQGQLQDGWQPLVEEVAYEQWHRMLFARFLAANNLLIHPEGAAVTLEECAELAPAEGEPDAWALAARYASQMLPGIFQLDDPSAQVRLTPEGRQALEEQLQELPPVLFTVDDGLGWVYQFWQAKKKDEVNRSGRKIGGADLFPVTQLFTEDYMVRFLLENSLGAWWAARHPKSPLVKEFAYLRFRDDGTPAAGSFPGWPERVAEITLMDPCCGSGHFLVAAFEILRHMRMEEEGLAEAEAADAVLRDNLFGLEIDPRCTQIAAFALALTAWRIGSYRELPVPNIACSGIPVEGQLKTWTALASDNGSLRITLERLYHLFRNAPDLGSLISPADIPLRDRMFIPSFAPVEPILAQALSKGRQADDPVATVFGIAAQGLLRAARLLANTYTLVTTNVPYLGRDKQAEMLRDYCSDAFARGKADLATAFIERCVAFCKPSGSAALVTPQNWLFLRSYKSLRCHLLETVTWRQLAFLGAGAFETIRGEVVKAVLVTVSCSVPARDSEFPGLDVSELLTAHDKARGLRTMEPGVVDQMQQVSNPDCRIVIGKLDLTSPLNRFASICEGLHTGDYPRFGRKFWEIARVGGGWTLQQGGPKDTTEFAGREHVLFWEDGLGTLIQYVRERLDSETVTMWIKGSEAWGKQGVVVSTVSSLKATLYSGEVFTHGVVAIIPKSTLDLPAIWAFCRSSEFRQELRRIDRKVAVARGAFDAVPFDLARWRAIAEQGSPLSEPISTDPTQWVFDGKPAGSVAPLHVAVARLANYVWPQQQPDELNDFASHDGIVCLPPIAGEASGHERLRSLLAVAFKNNSMQGAVDELLSEVDYQGKELTDWLQDAFFAQHCSLFHNRPFIWHIWDGRRDGFAALINYHKLNAALMEKLIYMYLGNWIRDQKADLEGGIVGAEGRLIAALRLKERLETIRDGEPPYDIYVRWKQLHEQPIGWNPDLNDGVRVNIRPFVLASVLRSKFTINWEKSKGNNPDGSERPNDLHYTGAEKLVARKNVGVKTQ